MDAENCEHRYTEYFTPEKCGTYCLRCGERKPEEKSCCHDDGCFDCGPCTCSNV